VVVGVSYSFLHLQDIIRTFKCIIINYNGKYTKVLKQKNYSIFSKINILTKSFNRLIRRRGWRVIHIKRVILPARYAQG
jgi:hypothetical protein